MQRDEVEENVKVVYYRMFITATKFQAHVRYRIHDLPTDVTHCLTKSNTREERRMRQRAWQQRHTDTQTTPLTRGSPGHRDQGALALRTPARAIVPPTFNHCGSSPQLNLSRKTTIHTLEVCLLDKSIKSTMRVNSHRDDATSILKMYQYILLFTYTKNCILTFKKLIKQNKNRSGP